MVSETPVLIVGGGPAGLAASLTLSHLGIGSMLVNKYPGTLEHPKAVGLMQRTAELLRLWGAEDEMRSRGVPREFCDRMVWTTTLSADELGRTETVEPDDTASEPQSPTMGLRCPQNITESVLRDRAQSHDLADLHYGFEMTGFEQDADGVTATIVARDGGAPSTVQARYMIAADGNDSAVRRACGIGRAGDADMGHFVNIFHRAPLGPLVRDRPGWSYAVITPELTGSFVTINGDDVWLFHVNLAAGETVEDFTQQRCVDTVRHAAGINDLDVDLISIKSWILGAELSTAFRDRRVLLTGDAAHRTTPDGGVGMNTGLHSAHNLAWKVGAVVSGWAGAGLLDTYEIERRSVAETNVAYSANRGSGIMKMIEAVRAGDLDTVRAGIAARPPGGRQGMDLGFRYEAGAVAPDGTAPPQVENPVADYVQNACPGGRAPHLWVKRDGARMSTLDAFGGGLVLLAASDGAAAWRAAADHAAVGSKVPVEVLSVGAAGELQVPAGRFETLYGVEPDGAVLVRPDGFVGWRAQHAGDAPAEALDSALATILKL
ncbi:FAD-dependent monooxygenase [Capillimicrobium parvum]|uniref:Aklavinone 12-hydroxylase RdmE n=1 Tax=Capillimicrobium parvum TaxID=2884022 RepID=A0A9E6XW72_9ACTN|nr:FAD-dependent monooxygenase [Capillimicrobium parvum]UGS34942.1 Aklavinone 12-hydroxylase RdmE [Capillimicrobium parvum]